MFCSLLIVFPEEMMSKKVTIPREYAVTIIDYCNKDLVPNDNFDPKTEYHSNWFENQFSFVSDQDLKKQLGMAFYQARFIYKLMSALRLPRFKHYGIVKFQIIQYASICEAVITHLVKERFFFQLRLHLKNSPSEKGKKKRSKLRNPNLRDYIDVAIAQGLISSATGDGIKGLYQVRNNVHLLRASKLSYKPKLYEAIDGYNLVKNMIAEIEDFDKVQNSISN